MMKLNINNRIVVIWKAIAIVSSWIILLLLLQDDLDSFWEDNRIIICLIIPFTFLANRLAKRLTDGLIKRLHASPFFIPGLLFISIAIMVLCCFLIYTGKIDNGGLKILISLCFAVIFVLEGIPFNKKSNDSPSSVSSVDNSNNLKEERQSIHKNDKEKRYQVFISSTIDDLQMEREKVMQAVLKQKCFPACLELFPATNDNKFDYIKQEIDESDYFVLIVAARYGSIDDDGISDTEKEYKYAVEKGIPVFAFLHGDIGSIRRDKCDTDTALFQKLKAFRESVDNGNAQRWTNADQLSEQVSNSLRDAFERSPRPGWVRDNQINKRRKTKAKKKTSKN